MKIAPRAVSGFLKQPGTAYGALLYGPDEGLARARMLELRKALLGSAEDPMAVTMLSEEQLRADPALLADALNALSLLGGKSLVVLRDASDKCTSAIKAAMEGNPVHYLIAAAGELPPRSSLRQLFETHPRLAALPCYKDEGADLSGVIAAHLREAGIAPQAGVMEYLSAHLGNDRGVTVSEINKLILYLGERRMLALEDASAVIGNNREAQMDELALAVAEGAAGTVERQLARILREGAQPVAALRAVQRHFQRLYQLRAEADSGIPVASAVSQLRPPVFFRHVPQVTQQAQRWNRSKLAYAFALLSRAEIACKSGTVSSSLVCANEMLRVTAL